jgi:type I restriction enzyme S subunit
MPTLKPYPAYKPAAVPWLQQVPEHWESARAKSLFRKVERPVRPEDETVTCFRDGMVTLRKNRRATGYTESLKEIGYQGIRKGDLVIHIMDAFAGSMGVSDSEGKSTPVYSVCVPRGSEVPWFFAFQLRQMAKAGWLQALSKGIRERSSDFRFELFGMQTMLVPPVDEQHLIVRYLHALDAKVKRYIRTKRTLIARLQEQKQAIIQRAVTRGLNPNVKLKPSGVEWLGEVPEHWEVKQLKQAASILRGKFSHRPRNDPRFYGGQYPFIQTGSIARANKLITEYKQTLNENGLAVSKLFPKGTLVMAIAANIGDVAVLTFDSCAPDSVIGFLPMAQTHQDYLYLTLTAMKPELLAEAPVNTQGNLSIARVGSMVMPYPPFDEQRIIAEHINERVTHIDQNISLILRTMEQVHEYHTRLIADVVTGAVDVREASEALPAEDAFLMAEEHIEVDMNADV